MQSFSIRDEKESTRVKVSDCGSIKTKDFFTFETAEGKNFVWSHFYPAIADTATASMILRPSGVTNHLYFNIMAEGDAHYTIHELPVLSAAGTTLDPVCTHRSQKTVSGTSCFYTPTITSYSGTTLLQGYIPNLLGGGSGARVFHWHFPSNVTVAVSVRNCAGAAKNIGIEATWNEE